MLVYVLFVCFIRFLLIVIKKKECDILVLGYLGFVFSAVLAK